MEDPVTPPLVVPPDQGEESQQESGGATRGKAGMVKRVWERWILTKPNPDQSGRAHSSSLPLSPGPPAPRPGRDSGNLTPKAPDKGQPGNEDRARPGPQQPTRAKIPLLPQPAPEPVPPSPPPPRDSRRRLPPGSYRESPPSGNKKKVKKPL